MHDSWWQMISVMSYMNGVSLISATERLIYDHEIKPI